MSGSATRNWNGKGWLLLLGAAALVGFLLAANSGAARAGVMCTIAYHGYWVVGELSAGDPGQYDCADAQAHPELLINKVRLLDANGNPIPADQPKPGWLFNEQRDDDYLYADSYVGVYPSGRFLPPQELALSRSDCIPYPNYCDVSLTLRQTVEFLRALPLESPGGTDTAEVVYEADANNRVVLDFGRFSVWTGQSRVRYRVGNVYYREAFVNGVWIRSNGYGVDEEAKVRAAWNACYLSQGRSIGPPGGDDVPEECEPGEAANGNGSPSGGIGASPSGPSGPSTPGPTAPPTCEELYSHLPPTNRILICSGI